MKLARSSKLSIDALFAHSKQRSASIHRLSASDSPPYTGH